MKAIILAAGYATRLYPLTLTTPKPLLPVAGKPMIDHVVDNLSPIASIDEIFVITNAKFAAQFETWAKNERHQKLPFQLTIINDGTTDETNRLGAIGDLHLAIGAKNLDADLLVVAGDNLFSEKLDKFADYCLHKKAPVLGVYDVGSLEAIKKYNAIVLDGAGCIKFFEEKPLHPLSTLTGIALYFYPRPTLALIRQYIAEKNNPDQPGRLVQWMYQRIPFYTWRVPGIWFDIGSKEHLEEANQVFSKK